MRRVPVNTDEHSIVLLGACQGLEGEADRTVEAILEIEPESVALGLDPHLVDHVDEFQEGSPFSVEDEAYQRGLEEWGEVRLPPPEYEAAANVADRIGAGLHGVDLPEPEYMDRYTDTVGVLDLTRRALRVRWLKTMPPNVDSPIAFCEAFDRRVNQGPYRDLEELREREIARRLKELARSGPVVCVLEVQRVQGVKEALEARASRTATEPG